MLGTRLSTSNLKCVARRIEDSGGTWLEASHNLFAKLNGYSHHRRIYLMTDGYDFRGERIHFSHPAKPKHHLNLPFGFTFIPILMPPHPLTENPFYSPIKEARVGYFCAVGHIWRVCKSWKVFIWGSMAIRCVATKSF